MTPQIISIHAPARGATVSVVLGQWMYCDFNPRSRTGSDPPAWRTTKFSKYFNPRSRTGSDVTQFCFSYARINFNPRSRTGSDRAGAKVIFDSRISIHAPARGATSMAIDFSPKQKISIHAPARGATSPILQFVREIKISIHAPARGATSTGEA